MSVKTVHPHMYGILAEFATADALVQGARKMREAGFSGLEAYSPFPVEGLAEALGFESNRVPLITFAGGVAGGAGAYLLQWYSAVIDYPINIGGRPLNSWPSFLPATFELAVLGAALAAVFGMLFLNGLPKLRHPLFEVNEFDLATRNRFFLCLRAKDAGFDSGRASSLLRELQPLLIREVPL